MMMLENEEAKGEQTEENVEEEKAENTEFSETPEIDYAALARDDVKILSEEFLELEGLNDITELENPLRYAALRDLGLTPAEAYLATTRRKKERDNRAHLERSVPRRASIPNGVMSERELSEAREIFSGISDAEIKRLYKKVTR